MIWAHRRLAGPSVLVGTDIVAICEVRASLERFGRRYTDRVFTRREVAAADDLSSLPIAARLAARFAAKEATVKVLRPVGATPPWRTIEVVTHPHGWCDVELSGEAAALARRSGISGIALSLSHEREFAVATAVAWVNTTGGWLRR